MTAEISTRAPATTDMVTILQDGHLVAVPLNSLVTGIPSVPDPRNLGALTTAPATRSDKSALVAGDYYTDVSTPAAPVLYFYGTGGFKNIAGNAPANGSAVSFNPLFTGSTASTVERKGQQIQSILDVNGRVPGVTYDAYPEFAVINLLAGEWLVPRGIHQVSKSNTTGWKGNYRFEPGAMIQAASGVTVLWDGAHWEANEYQQVIDLSAGGVHSGKLRNASFSICWTGADPTGTNPSGPAVDAAFKYALVRRVLAPYSMDGKYYAMKNYSILQTSHMSGPQGASTAVNNSPIFYWDTDLGAAGDATTTEKYYWRMPSVKDNPESLAVLSLKGITLKAPSNATARSLTPYWNTDLFAMGRLGDTGNGDTNMVQARIEQVTFDGGRFGFVSRTGNGHSIIDRCQFQFNFAGIASVSTGGDFHFLGCNGVSFQCSMFYHWNNTGWEQGLIIRDHYAGQLPYFFYQDPTNHPDKASTGAAGITSGGEFTNLSTEVLGNGFIYGTTGAYIVDTVFTNVVHDLLWYGDSSGTIISGQPRDYAIVLGGWVNCRMAFGKDGSGYGTFGGGLKGVIKSTNVISGQFENFVQKPSVPYFTCPTVQVKVLPLGHLIPTIFFQAAGTVQDGAANTTYGYGGHSDGQTFDYVLSAEERESQYFMFPQFAMTYGDASIGATCTLYNSDRNAGRTNGLASLGAYVRITLSKPVTGNTYGFLRLFSQ